MKNPGRWLPDALDWGSHRRDERDEPAELMKGRGRRPAAPPPAGTPQASATSPLAYRYRHPNRWRYRHG